MNKVVLGASELEGCFTLEDKKNLVELDNLYAKALKIFPNIRENEHKANTELISIYNEIGSFMQEICKNIVQIHIYPFLTSKENRSEASHIIAKLRDTRTETHEFVYYTQRAFEILFKLAWGGLSEAKKNYLTVKTFVTNPVQNYAVHKIANIDDKIGNTVMCVMLRGALLPSMIMSKEIQGYSSNNYITPFALFKIKRNECKKENNMEYILDTEFSFFDPEKLKGKDLVFADPMNATGGSLITVVKYILSLGIKPRSIKIFNVISAFKGALRVTRTLENCDVYTLWMDPVLNEDAYIMPGLGDAGDRINGKDSETNPRNIIRLIADYGAGIANLYKSQLREIENTVLG